MKSQLTLGPLRVANHDTLKYVRHVDAGPVGYERTTVAILDGPHSDAYATLFSAAPELLEALRSILNGSIRISDKRDDMLSEHNPKVIAARAAIARATQP